MLTLLIACTLNAAPDAWQTDFRFQPTNRRPALEVAYTDGAREAFEVMAEDYHVIGQLRQPHHLVDAGDGVPWLTLSVTGADGTVYKTDDEKKPSRINLYRRGPYFCEVHWLDVRVADGAGNRAPLKGDLALYCYPDKLLASITWHATEDFAAKEVYYHGRHGEKAFTPEPFTKGSKQQFAFPVFGEEEPLPGSALETLEAHTALRYDAVRGCYTVGSSNPGGFEGHFVEHPEYRELVTFKVTNGGYEPRKIYICHETSGDNPGSVEGGVVLDEDGHMLPLTVQISKNFAGEKEEKFYNPTDIPFSENYFPLYLEPGESHTLTSIHLYQNWGSHMTKHFSSLGAWMDYFHSSTGITETTCYVPFKFGGLPGVTIADFRAMSQDTFWTGQAQHDNVAGHSFLSYNDGQQWQYMTYRGTTYDSTGPNWMDIGLEYLSSDGKIRTTVRTFEYPQADELRNFINVRMEALEPITVENARENFRMLTVAWWVQRLRYTHVAATGLDPVRLSFDEQHFAVRGHPLPRENSFLSMYGEPKGSNGIVIRNWEGPVGPAVSALCEANGNTRLLLVPDADTVHLEKGDAIAFEGMWLPYGEIDGARIPAREAVRYGSDGPRISDVTVGEKIADFPPEVRAENNRAEFTLRGGRSVVAVLVKGLTEFRWPRVYRKESTGWVPILQARNGDLDGIEVYTDKDGSFGAAFVVATGEAPQRLKVEAGKNTPPRPRITVKPMGGPEEQPRWHVALLQAPWMDAPIKLRFPETVHTDALDFIDHVRDDMPPRVAPEPLAKQWREDPGGTLFFEWVVADRDIGGRLSPLEDEVDLQFWVDNRGKPTNVNAQFCPVLSGTMFEDRTLDRTWIHAGGTWVKAADTDRGEGDPALCHYPVEGGPELNLPKPWGVGGAKADADVVAVTSADGKHLFAIAWPQPAGILSNSGIPCAHTDPMLPHVPGGRRAHVRGKVYLMEGTLDDLYARVQRDILRKF